MQSIKRVYIHTVVLNMSDEKAVSLFNELRDYDSRNPFTTKLLLASIIYNRELLINLSIVSRSEWVGLLGFNVADWHSWLGLIAGLAGSTAIACILLAVSLCGGYLFAYVKRWVEVRQTAKLKDIEMRLENDRLKEAHKVEISDLKQGHIEDAERISVSNREYRDEYAKRAEEHIERLELKIKDIENPF